MPASVVVASPSAPRVTPEAPDIENLFDDFDDTTEQQMEPHDPLEVVPIQRVVASGVQLPELGIPSTTAETEATGQ